MAQTFYIRCGIHPTKAPEPLDKEQRWRPADPPDIAAVFQNRKATDIEKWFQT